MGCDNKRDELSRETKLLQTQIFWFSGLTFHKTDLISLEQAYSSQSTRYLRDQYLSNMFDLLVTRENNPAKQNRILKATELISHPSYIIGEDNAQGYFQRMK